MLNCCLTRDLDRGGTHNLQFCKIYCQIKWNGMGDGIWSLIYLQIIWKHWFLQTTKQIWKQSFLNTNESFSHIFEFFYLVSVSLACYWHFKLKIYIQFQIHFHWIKKLFSSKTVCFCSNHGSLFLVIFFQDQNIFDLKIITVQKGWVTLFFF